MFKGLSPTNPSIIVYVLADTTFNGTSFCTVESLADPYNGTTWPATYRLHFGLTLDAE